MKLLTNIKNVIIINITKDTVKNSFILTDLKAFFNFFIFFPSYCYLISNL